MKNKTEILIQWDMIDKKYKHARMDATKKVYAYRNSPKISAFGNSWVGDYINITDLIKGDISELDWKKFKATRSAETLRDVDFDSNCDPQIGKSYFVKFSYQDDSFFRKCYIVGKSKDSKWLIFEEKYGNLEQHNIDNGVFTFKHIDHSANN